MIGYNNIFGQFYFQRVPDVIFKKLHFSIIMFTKSNALFKGNVLERNPLWCCDESPSPPTGKRVKVVTLILLFMLEKILYFWFPSQDTHETCLLAPLIPKRGTPSYSTLYRLQGPFKLSNSSPMTSEALVLCWSLSSLSCLYHWTLFTPFSIFYLLGHCSPTVITPSSPHTSLLLLPHLQHWLLSASASS